MSRAAEISVTEEEAADVLATIGRNIRTLRTEHGMTLQALALRTGLSTSMLSLLERGRTGPSIGTLVGIAAALGTQMSDLLDERTAREEGMVSRVAAQRVYKTEEGVSRRILRHDRLHGLEIALNEFEPGTATVPRPRSHEGYEYGVVLEGGLEVTVNGRTQSLRPGDLISYSSAQSHRIANRGKGRARALWVNLRRD